MTVLYGLHDLKKNKGDALLTNKKICKDEVIVGDNVACLLQFCEKVESDEKALILNRDLTCKSYFSFWNSLPSLVRGGESEELLRQRFPRMGFKKSEESLFYKDQVLKEFGGRARPLKMLTIEPFFSKQATFFDYRDFFGTEKLEAFDRLVSKGVLKSSIKRISFSEKDEYCWKIALGDGTLLETKKIFWGEKRSTFWDVCSEKLQKSFSDLAKESFYGYQYLPALLINFSLKEGSKLNGTTVLLPQSYSHDWGHYIIELKEKDGLKNLSALAVLRDEEVNEESMGKKIKEIKKQIKRILPDFFDVIDSENVCFKDNLFCVPRESINNESFQAVFQIVPRSSLAFLNTEVEIDKDRRPFFLSDFPFLLTLLNSYINSGDEKNI